MRSPGRGIEGLELQCQSVSTAFYFLCASWFELLPSGLYP
jgi:hypothetical protein